MRRARKVHGVLAVAVLALLAGRTTARPGGFDDVSDVLGPRLAASARARPLELRPARRGTAAKNQLLYWNALALNACAIDHTPVAEGESRVFGEQLGPGRTSRAMAIVHIAIFDAINAIAGRYTSYTDLEPGPAGTSMPAAIAQAAHDTLVALYPSQSEGIDAALAENLSRFRDTPAKANGIELGSQAAAAILALRANDGSDHSEPVLGVDFFTSDEPGLWRQDPISLSPIALGAHWAGVSPFVLASADQFRAPEPAALDSPEYAAAFDEVNRLGGDGVVTPTERTDEQTEIGIFWGYDGTPGLGTPPRMYNQIAVQIARRRSGVVELARLLALINAAMADAGIAVWESKYVYEYWRPVTAVREADPGTGPTGAGDGNDATIGDPTFTPLGAQASNLTGPNFTPPFPAYPSGHAGFGAALFETLRNFYGTDDISFTFVSDELNGETADNQGNVRPRMPRTFTSLSEAEEENGQSRIYLGIHWSFDKTAGIEQGRRVADYVFANAFTPVASATP